MLTTLLLAAAAVVVYVPIGFATVRFGDWALGGVYTGGDPETEAWAVTLWPILFPLALLTLAVVSPVLAVVAVLSSEVEPAGPGWSPTHDPIKPGKPAPFLEI